MNLTPREKDKLLISMAAMVARRRLERGVKLNHPEAIALITDFVVGRRARRAFSVPDLMEAGAHVISRDQVMEGIPEMIHDIQIEATFPDGTKLRPCTNRSVEEAPCWLCVPIANAATAICRRPFWPLIPCPPSASGKPKAARLHRPPDYEREDKHDPGEVLAADGEIELNVGLETVTIEVSNTGDRPVQVGSHYHFAETNAGFPSIARAPMAAGWIFRPARPCGSSPARRGR